MNKPASLLESLSDNSARLITSSGAISDPMLIDRVMRCAEKIDSAGLTRIASQLDNSPQWLVLDLALRELGVVHIPLPTFFSPAQIQHALSSSGAQCVITDQRTSMPTGAESLVGMLDQNNLVHWHVPASAPTPLPVGTACITYTSGTTGQSKGVCLSASTLLEVASSLVQASAVISPRRHLCLMPLSTLLENVAGLYATLLADAEIALPSLAEIGYTGAAGLDVQTLLRCLHRYQPESVILVPQLLLALVMAAEQGLPLPSSLRYLAVGGGRVGPSLLRRARALGLPVFEGYGLTECASVVCLNRPGAQREGSVGQPLPHAKVSVIDSEVMVEGARALGYLDATPLPAGPIRTGDLGHLDPEGFLHITGRRKSVFITAFGRNVSPEWVESELLAHPALAQVVVWGEGRADNLAVVVPRRPDIEDALLTTAFEQVNAGLPDYARVARFVRATQPFNAANGLLTGNGRPRREAILSHYQAAIDQCYRNAPALSVSGANS